MDVLRDSIAGQLLRLVTGNKVLLYPEEKSDFVWPPPGADFKTEEKSGANSESDAADGAHTDLETKSLSSDPSSTQRDPSDVEKGVERETETSKANPQTKTADGTIIVDWYSADDKANPQNWSPSLKYSVLVQLAAYTLAVYGSSSMIVPGSEGIMEQFHVGFTPAALGLSMFVIGYAFGPLLWAPLCEIPAIGRNWVYVPTFFLFVILSIPTAVVNNFGGLLVLRFLTGFFGSPCLSNGGASIGDMYGFLQLPIYISSWTAACFWGPAIGIIISGFAVQAKGWRWGLWEIVWLNAPILIVVFFIYPETSADNILRRRAQRIRKRTGLSNIKSQSEINQAHMNPREVAYDALIKPMEIMMKDPAVLFTNVYTALIYGIYYSFFEVFPLVFPPIYGFNLGETGLVFLAAGIGSTIALIFFILYQIYFLIPDIKKNGLGPPEQRLIPALIGVFFLPAGFFLFGWTSRESVHWIVPMIGVSMSIMGNFWIFQSVFIYLPLSYPKYAASLFAANDMCRALLSAGCVLFARPMFVNLGIGSGVSVLAGLSCMGIFGMFFLWQKGAWLRSKSTFAQH